VIATYRAKNKYQRIKKGNNQQGFSILEASIALTTLGVALAYSMPLFLYSKMNNTKSEIRTGALMVAQRILDNTRGTPFQTIPTTGSITYLDKSTPSPPTGSSLADLQAMGRTYAATTYHCEVASDCTDNYKTLRVEVKQNGATVYEMSAGFTNFR
jgi:type II secretory pathway pseudopilin PulG